MSTALQPTLESLREQATGTSASMIGSALRQTDRIARLAASRLGMQRIDSPGHLILNRRLIPAHELVAKALAYVRSETVTTRPRSSTMMS